MTPELARRKKAIATGVSKKPDSLAVVPDGIPKTLTEVPQWVAWDYQLNKRGDKWAKLPLDPGGKGLASTTDRATWGTANAAWRRYKPNGAKPRSGIGFVFAEAGGLVGIDLDACRDPETGALDELAKSVVEKFSTYTEVSPSLLGVKLWCKGTWSPDADNQNAKHGIEVYGDSRYFAVTGVRVEGTPAEVRECQAELDWLRDTYFPKATKKPTAGSATKTDEPKANTSNATGGSGHKLIVSKYLAAFGREFRVKDKPDKRGRTRYVLAQCVFDKSRADPDAMIGQSADGKLSYKCLHVSCAGRGWQDAKREIGKPANDHFDPPIIRATIKGVPVDDEPPAAGTPPQAGEAESPAMPKISMPQVTLGPDEFRVVAEALPGLALDPDLYQRGGEFVRVDVDADTKTPVIAPIATPDLRRRVTRRVRLFNLKVTSEGEELVPAHPPEWLPLQLAAHPGKDGIRQLAGLSGVPVLRADGPIHDKAGYDPHTRTVYVPGDLIIPPLSNTLTQANAARAAGELLELVRDFPFGDPAGKSVYLSFVLSTLARHLFDGGVPLHLADANVRGSGKGLILDVAGVIVLGGPIPVQQYTSDAAEMRKVITSVVRAGRLMQHLDNLPSGEPFGNASLDSALTCPTWEDRLLGTNTKVSYPHRVVWAASGNNPTIRADTMRRLIRIRLESSRATPEDRADFVYPDLIGHVRANRAKYVTAALTVVAAYLRAGRPAVAIPAAGSFGGWTSIIRSSIVWAGQPDPWKTNLSAREELDTESGELFALVCAWTELDPEGKGITTAEAKKRKCNLFQDWPYTNELLTVIGAKEFDTTEIGYLLRKHKGRWTEDGRSIAGASGHGGANRWRVVEKASSPSPPRAAANGGDGGNGDHAPHASRVTVSSNSQGGMDEDDRHQPHHPHHEGVSA